MTWWLAVYAARILSPFTGDRSELTLLDGICVTAHSFAGQLSRKFDGSYVPYQMFTTFDEFCWIISAWQYSFHCQLEFRHLHLGEQI
jgi:hypothetical protein